MEARLGLMEDKTSVALVVVVVVLSLVLGVDGVGGGVVVGLLWLVLVTSLLTPNRSFYPTTSSTRRGPCLFFLFISKRIENTNFDNDHNIYLK